MTHVLLLNRGAHKLVQGAAPEQHQVLTQHWIEPPMEERHLVLISLGVVGAILREVVKLLDVLVHTARPLLQVPEFLKLASHQAHGDVVPTEFCVELSSWQLVVVLNSGGEVSPPSTHGSTKLLGCEQSLLELNAMQQSKLGLEDAKPVIRFQWISCLSKHQRVRCQEVDVGSLHPWLAVGRAHHTLHEVLHQHPHELVLRG
jgi:hypothetical protein